MTEDSATWAWMSDDPLENPTGDPRSKYFDREAFVRSIASAIGTSRDQSVSSVFGLVGAWGSGKTTIVASLVDHLTSAKWNVHHFNPWLYSGSESLIWGFFSELRGAIPPDGRWNDTRANLETLRNTVVPLAKIASAFGIGIADAAENLLDPSRMSATRVREKIAKQLKDLTQPVLVVIDDLDRLTAGELLEVFKLVRFIGRLPNVYYLLCYDEKTLVDLLEKTDLVGERNERRALDYLEKIVQLRFDIPPIRIELAESYFEEALRGLVRKCGLTFTIDDERRFAELVRSGLVDRLTTPRAFRHLFAQIEAFLPSIVNEVDTVDFVLLSWIRTFEPSLYGQLLGERAFLLHGNIGFEFDKSKAGQKRRTRLDNVLTRGQVTPVNAAVVLSVLQSMFPVIGRIMADAEVSGLPELGGRRVADDFYFDRYFNFGVPADDLHDATVRLALAALEQSDLGSTELRKLELQLAVNTRRTIEKIERERAQFPEVPVHLARWSLKQFTRLPEQNGWAAPRDLLTDFLATVLVDVNVSSLSDLVKGARELGVEATFMLLYATSRLAGRSLGGEDAIRAWNQRGKELSEEVLTGLSEFMDPATKGPLFDLGGYTWLVLFLWEELDHGGPANLVRKRLDSGTWSSLDVLARLVGSTVPSGSGPGAISSISGFDATWVGRFIDLAAARSQLSQEIEAAGNLGELHRAEATPENRRRYALAWLKANSEVDRIQVTDSEAHAE